jgi:hypothetical protein
VERCAFVPKILSNSSLVNQRNASNPIESPPIGFRSIYDAEMPRPFAAFVFALHAVFGPQSAMRRYNERQRITNSLVDSRMSALLMRPREVSPRPRIGARGN